MILDRDRLCPDVLKIAEKYSGYAQLGSCLEHVLYYMLCFDQWFSYVLIDHALDQSSF